MNRRTNRVIFLLLITGLMLACVPTLSSAPQPTFDPNSINTIIVETANAASTQTALFTTPSPIATFTPLATSTATETATPVPTIFIQLATPTVPTAIPQVNTGPDDKFDCQILSKTPADGFGFSAGIEFTVIWQVVNTGQAEWNADSADARYLSGTKMHLQNIYDLDYTVPPGGQYAVTVKMKAPSESGTYSTIWVIKAKDEEYCRMGISIKV